MHCGWGNGRELQSDTSMFFLQMEIFHLVQQRAQFFGIAAANDDIFIFRIHLQQFIRRAPKKTFGRFAFRATHKGRNFEPELRMHEN